MAFAALGGFSIMSIIWALNLTSASRTSRTIEKKPKPFHISARYLDQKSRSIYTKSVVCLCEIDLVDKFHDSERFDVTQKLTIETTTIDATVRQDVDL